MQIPGSRNDYGLKVVASRKPAEVLDPVGVSVGSLVVVLFDKILSADKIGLVDIADGRHVHARQSEQRTQQTCPAIADAHHASADHSFILTHGGLREAGRSGDECSPIE
jgi:hypothetical protein